MILIYLKYKKKYLELQSKLKGGTPNVGLNLAASVDPEQEEQVAEAELEAAKEKVLRKKLDEFDSQKQAYTTAMVNGMIKAGAHLGFRLTAKDDNYANQLTARLKRYGPPEPFNITDKDITGRQVSSYIEQEILSLLPPGASNTNNNLYALFIKKKAIGTFDKEQQKYSPEKTFKLYRESDLDKVLKLQLGNKDSNVSISEALNLEVTAHVSKLVSDGIEKYKKDDDIPKKDKTDWKKFQVWFEDKYKNKIHDHKNSIIMFLVVEE